MSFSFAHKSSPIFVRVFYAKVAIVSDFNLLIFKLKSSNPAVNFSSNFVFSSSGKDTCANLPFFLSVLKHCKVKTVKK